MQADVKSIRDADLLATALYAPRDVRNQAETLDAISREVLRLKARLELLEAARKVVASKAGRK